MAARNRSKDIAKRMMFKVIVSGLWNRVRNIHCPKALARIHGIGCVGQHVHFSDIFRAGTIVFAENLFSKNAATTYCWCDRLVTNARHEGGIFVHTAFVRCCRTNRQRSSVQGCVAAGLVRFPEVLHPKVFLCGFKSQRTPTPVFGLIFSLFQGVCVSKRVLP